MTCSRPGKKYNEQENKKHRKEYEEMKKRVFAALAVIGIMMVLGSPAFAEDAAADSFKDYGLFAAGLGIAIAALAALSDRAGPLPRPWRESPETPTRPTACSCPWCWDWS